MADADVQGMLIRIEATTAQLRQEMARGDSAVAQSVGKIDKSLAQADSAFDRLAQSAALSGNLIITSFKAAGAAVAGFQIAGAVKDATELASRYNQLGVVLETIGGNAGYSAEQLKGYELGLQKVGISAIESRNNLSKMIGANLDLAQASKLARVAQDAAVIGNISSSEAYARLVDGIASAEIETLRGIGLNVNFENSYLALAKQLGVTSNELTEQQKAQARANIAIQAGVNIAGAYEASLTNAGKMLKSTSRYVEDLSVALGQTTQPAFTAAVEQYSAGLKFLSENTKTVISVLEMGLYVALARSTAALINAGVARVQATIAEAAGLKVTAAAADANLYSANMALRKAGADLAGARAAVAAATSETEMAVALRARTLASGAVAAATLRVGVASTEATVANGALIASTTVLGRAMGLASVATRGLWTALGGPVGILMTLVAVGLAFVDFGDKAEENSDKAATATESAAVRIRKAARDMTPGNLATATLEQLKAQKTNLDQQLAAAEMVQTKLQALTDNDVPTVGDMPTLVQTKEKVQALQAAISSVTKEIDGSRFASDKAGQSATDNLSKQASMLGAVTEVEKLRRMEATGQLKIAVDQRDATYANAKAIDDYNAKQKELQENQKGAKKAESELESERKKQAKALSELTAATDISVTKNNGLAEAYFAGTNKLYEYTLQQKVEEELLKTGAGARAQVTAAIKSQMDAQAKADLGKRYDELIQENELLVAQTKATLQGADALAAFNITKAMTIALAGKSIDVSSKAYQQLLDQTKAQLANNKALEQANAVEGIVDRLNPQIKLLRDYTKEQDDLNAAIALGTDKTPLYQDALAKLGLEYEQNKNAATAWGKFTEGAIDRIDGAFADMWQSVLSKSGNFMDTLKNSFRQFLAEMLHMAITKPIIMQIGASLGVGGLAAQQGGILGSSGSGGLNLESAFNSVSGAYSVATSGFGQAVNSGWSAGEGFLGGIQGAFKAGAGQISAATASLFASSGGTMVNGVYQLSASAAPATVDLIANTVTNSSTGVVTGTATGATTAASAGLSASSAVMYGIGGAIQGYLKAGVKGAVAGAGGAVAGAYAGAAIGSAVPIIGTAIGAAIGAVLGGMFGSSLFGGDWVTKDQGFQLGVTGGELDAASFEYQKKKGGLFSSNKKRTRLTAMDPEMQAALDKTYAVTLGSVIGLFDSLDVELNDAVLDGLNVAATQISTRDKTAEQIQEELAKWFTGLGDAAVAEVSKVTGSGLDGFNLEGLTTFVNNLYSVNSSLEMIGVEMVGFNISGGRAIESLVALAGGMDTLNKSMTSFYNGFTTETQKSVDTLDGVRAQFVAMGLTLPATREAFSEAVKGLDLTSQAEREIFNSMTANAEQAAAAYSILEQRQSDYYTAFYSESENAARSLDGFNQVLKDAGVSLPPLRAGFRDLVEAASKDTTAAGKKMYDTLMSLAGTAGSAYDILETKAASATQALTDALLGAVTGVSGAVTRAIGAERDKVTAAYNASSTSLNDMLTTANTSVSDLTGVSTSLSSALKALRGTSDDAVKMLRAQAQATLQSALATAKAGGSLSGFTGLGDALDTIGSNNTDLYSSLEEFNRDQGRTANVVAELNGINGKQLTSAEKLAKTLDDQLKQAKTAYDDQMTAFDSQLEFAQSQLDAINGVDNSILSVVDAVNAMNAAVVAAMGTVKSATPTNAGTLIDTAYQSALGQNADAAGKKYWQGELSSGSIGYDQLATAVKNAATENAIKNAYQSVLGHEADAAGAKYWANEVASGSMTIAQLQEAITNAAKANGSVIGHATGGLISGPGTGTSDSILSRLSNGEYVMTAAAVSMFGTGLLDQMNAGQFPAFASGGAIGEIGPQLAVTPPSRIYGANQSGSMIGGDNNSGVVAELRAIRAELESVKANTQAGALSGGKLVRIMDRATEGGNAMQVTLSGEIVKTKAVA